VYVHPSMLLGLGRAYAVCLEISGQGANRSEHSVLLGKDIGSMTEVVHLKADPVGLDDDVYNLGVSWH
jgi:hypothetical protein